MNYIFWIFLFLIKEIFSYNTSLINVSISPFNGIVLDLKWCTNDAKVNSSSPDNSETPSFESIILLSDDGILYKSDDNGISFATLEKALYGFGEEGRENLKNYGMILSIIQNPNEKSAIVVKGSKNVNWITRNCANDFQLIELNARVDDFQFHPFQNEWILASLFKKSESVDLVLLKELHLSINGGKSWTLLHKYINQFAWGCLEKNFAPVINEKRIIATIEDKFSGKQNLDLVLNENVHVYFSDDFFKTKNKTVKSGNRFLLTKSYIFVAKVLAAREKEISMHVSRHYRNYSFEEIKLPSKRKTDHSFTVLDASEDEVILHVLHSSLITNYGSAYVSNTIGTNYSLSIENVVRSADGQCDFEKIEGLRGTYIANIYSPRAVSDISEQTKELRSKKVLSYEERKSLKKYMNKLDMEKGSRITYDKGAIWSTLKAPDFDSKGKSIQCSVSDEDICVLNLNSVSSSGQFGPIYTNARAVGIIVGTGSVGSVLSTLNSQINTYISSDGGENWREILKGSHLYEIGDSGGVILAASDQEYTNEVLISFNTGISFYSYLFTERPIHIQMILSDPNNTSTNFIIVGKVNSGEVQVISLDLRADMRKCQGVDSPDSSGSDYEVWSHGSSEKCYLGAKFKFIRKKPEAECINTQFFTSAYSIESCECSEQDWECEPGFERLLGGGPCSYLGNEKKLFEPPEECVDYYFVSQGYRKVPGSLCEGGTTHYPLRMRCPHLRKRDHKVIAISMVGLLLLFALLFGSNVSGTIRGFLAEKFLSNEKEYKKLKKRSKANEEEMGENDIFLE